jgi:hypothetical protein
MFWAASGLPFMVKGHTPWRWIVNIDFLLVQGVLTSGEDKLLNLKIILRRNENQNLFNRAMNCLLLKYLLNTFRNKCSSKAFQ